ncbi:MAG: nucleoside hydrolase [Eubacteriales bacterium]|nr:nucleoside hydrolase [Eubacteriales bacterium]
MLDMPTLVQRLEPPRGRVLDMVLDTDAYNEIDDQFALAYAALSPSLNLQAVYAAPYFNEMSSSPADGMEKSYQEILHILSLLDDCVKKPAVFRGADRYMENGQPILSPATLDLIERAKARPAGDPLYVAAIGCPVNVSSAILACPEIIDKIVVVWLGGNAHTWKDSHEFNLFQDVSSSRVLFDSGVPLVQMPCVDVTTHLATTVPELEYYLGDAGGLGQYLTEIVARFNRTHEGAGARSKVVWDIITVAWLVNPDWVPTVLDHSPILHEDCRLSFDRSRHLIREAISVDRDAVFTDLFRKLGSKRL